MAQGEDIGAGACQVQCAGPGCRCILSVPRGVLNFQCPQCKLPQALPPLLHPRGVDSSKLQLPCANCRCILNVPPSLRRFVCPQCRVELAVDPLKLAAYRSSLAHLNLLSGQTPGLLEGPAVGDALDPASAWGRLHVKEEVNEVALEVEQEEDEGGTAGETFTDYRPSKLSIGPLHPDPIVETSSLSAVQPPEPIYELKIAPEIDQSGTLSCLQLETIVYASQRHMYHLADSSRAGFFIGDGAGVGKGRTIAGLVWENWQQGRRKALWLSVGSDLKFDARRDLDDIGATCVEVHALNKLPYGKLDSKQVGVREGVLFLTYSSLIASSEKGKSRLQQLVTWCGSNFEGLLVFDECHKAKNLIPEAGGQATRTGEAVLELQTRLADARVVYCSATGASEPRNMGYMARLGLWGPGTDFPHFQAFLVALEKRGVGALELVAMDMKARGMYLCRTLSFKSAEFAIDEVPLEPNMKSIPLCLKKMYFTATQFWNELRTELMVALEAVQDRRPNQTQLWRLYWANHQRFFRHICMSAKVPAAVRLAKQALSESKCVVIGLQSTGEARTEEAVNRYGVELDDFVSGPRELLLKLVEDHYPLPTEPKTLQGIDDEIVKGESRKRPFSSVSNVPGRGRPRKAAAPVESDEDGDQDDETESDQESTEVDDDVKFCSVCSNEDATQPLVECSLCLRVAHTGCHAPPITEVPLSKRWYCLDCSKELSEIQQERRLFIAEQFQRYEAAKERRAKVMEVIRTLDLPNNPLDDIIDQLGGPDCVAEMTGRRGMLVRAANGKGVIYQARNTKDVTMEMINMHEKQQFMDGKKLVAVISEAASAGVSLQADRRALNQKRRVHITLELPWSADRAIQQFGRTHRSNQASAPQYRLLITNLGGERRFASIVAKRLETLGALTQGDRRAGAGQSLSAYNYDSGYGKKALATVYKSVLEQIEPPVPPPVKNDETDKDFYLFARAALLCVGIIRDAQGENLLTPSMFSFAGLCVILITSKSVLLLIRRDISAVLTVLPFELTASQFNPGTKASSKSMGRISEADLHDVGRFLNRVLGLEPEFQNRLFEFFVSVFDDLIQGARKEGQFDSGIVDIRASSIELQEEPKPVHKDPMSGALTTLFILKVDKGFTFEEASQLLDQSSREDDMSDNGFYQSKREWQGRTHCLLAVEKSGSVSHSFRIFRPASGEAAREMSLAELRTKYSKFPSLAQAKEGWLKDYTLSADQCMHGPKCKVGSICTVGRRIQQMNILGGLILPVWGAVEKVLSKQVRTSHRKLRVVRLETTNDSKRIVGLHIPNPAVSTVLSGLNGTHNKPATPETLALEYHPPS
ncbi:hypothetical protein R1sor_018051 [Riccia sorocarpa]|uniref:PHD-type domain-containing protein n=1 Tax=Riccia sorocarpa TaxID=122646 RepID=A0ABD3IAC9_9MARC